MPSCFAQSRAGERDRSGTVGSGLEGLHVAPGPGLAVRGTQGFISSYKKCTRVKDRRAIPGKHESLSKGTRTLHRPQTITPTGSNLYSKPKTLP